MNNKGIIFLMLLAVFVIFTACRDRDVALYVDEAPRRSGSVPFVLPPLEDFKEHIHTVGVQAFRGNYTIEIVTYEAVSGDAFTDRPTIILLIDVYYERVGRAGFFDRDRLNMLGESYALAIESWLMRQAREQAQAQNAISASRENSFIVVVIGIGGIAVGSSVYDAETNTVLWTEY